MKRVITAMFRTLPAAERALGELDRAGFTEDDLSLVVTDHTKGKTFRLVESTKIDEGAVTGAAVGGFAGGLLGGFAAVGAIEIPLMNLVLTGMLISALTGLGAGALCGGVVGMLIGMGFPEHEAKIYQGRIRQDGHILLAVSVADRESGELAERILHRIEAVHIT